VPPGTFSVKVNLQGFKESLTTDVAVTEGGAIRVSSALQWGSFPNRSPSPRARPCIQTERAEVRTACRQRQLTNVPMPVGRNYQSLFVTHSWRLAAGEHALGGGEPVREGLGFHLQRHHAQLEHNSDRRRHRQQPVAASRGRLRAALEAIEDGVR
jgi:hypothetical protein